VNPSRLLAGVLVLAAAQVLAPDARAFDLNAYLSGEGHGNVALSFTSEGYDAFWMGTTKVFDPGVGRVETKTASLWIRYGLTERLNLIANLPYIDADSDGLGRSSERGLQDFTMLGACRLVSRGAQAKSTLLGAFGLRTSASNYEANLPVDIGDGTADWLARLVYQFEYRAFYASQQVGFDLRGGDAPNDVPLYTEIGFTTGPVTFNGFYSRLVAHDGTDIGDPGFTFPSNREEYRRAGIKVYGRVTGSFGLSAMAFTTLGGRNTGDSTGYSAGVVYGF
jgi:hypothetical protein